MSQKSVIYFLFFGLGSLLLAFYEEGGNFLTLLAPTAMLIVFGGTIGAVGVSFPVDTLKELPKVLKVLLSYKQTNKVELIGSFKHYTTITRREGLLVLEKELHKMENPFFKMGMGLMIDGIEMEVLKKIMELHMELSSMRHRKYSDIFDAAGGYSPTMGIIGTVMGLINVLSNLSDPGSLGPAIAMAFIATLFGVGAANILWLPVGARLKNHDKEEMYEKQMILEGLLLLQEGASPTLIVAKLQGFLNQAEVKLVEDTKSAKDK